MQKYAYSVVQYNAAKQESEQFTLYGFYSLYQAHLALEDYLDACNRVKDLFVDIDKCKVIEYESEPRPQ